jgi:hypothetical protein
VVLTFLGYSHCKLGDVDLGITLYKQALGVDPENVDTREYLGEGYVTVGQLDMARLELSEIEKRCGTTCEEYQELHKVLQSATSINPSHFATRVMPAIAATSMVSRLKTVGLWVLKIALAALFVLTAWAKLYVGPEPISFTKAASQCAE